jgi:hypothetical protein
MRFLFSGLIISVLLSTTTTALAENTAESLICKNSKDTGCIHTQRFQGTWVLSSVYVTLEKRGRWSMIVRYFQVYESADYGAHLTEVYQNEIYVSESSPLGKKLLGLKYGGDGISPRIFLYDSELFEKQLAIALEQSRRKQ